MGRKTHEIVTIEVAGRGEFPIDMLRYDMACPVRGEDAARIGRQTNAYELDDGDPGAVTWDNPIRLHVFASLGPTIARWGSFGWGVRVIA